MRTHIFSQASSVYKTMTSIFYKIATRVLFEFYRTRTEHNKMQRSASHRATCSASLREQSNRESLRPGLTENRLSTPAVLQRRTSRSSFLADKYAGHEACFGSDICFRNRMLLPFPTLVTLCGETSFLVSVPFSTPLSFLSRASICASPLTRRTWYMKHIATPSDGMTLTQPSSREIIPRDSVTPDGAVFLPPFRPVWITLFCATLFCDHIYANMLLIKYNLIIFNLMILKREKRFEMFLKYINVSKLYIY